MPESRVPVARMHLLSAAAALFTEALESGPSPQVEAAARYVDDALHALDAHGLDVRGTAQEDWGQH